MLLRCVLCAFKFVSFDHHRLTARVLILKFAGHVEMSLGSLVIQKLPFYGHQRKRYENLDSIDHYAALRFHLNYMPLMVKIDEFKLTFGDVLELHVDTCHSAQALDIPLTKWDRARRGLRKIVQSAIRIEIKHQRWTRFHIKASVDRPTVFIGHPRCRNCVQQAAGCQCRGPFNGTRHRIAFCRNSGRSIRLSYCTMQDEIKGKRYIYIYLIIKGKRFICIAARVVTVGATGNHQVRRSKDIDDMERLDAEEKESVTAVRTLGQLLHK